MEPIQLLAPDGTLNQHELYSRYLERLSDDDYRDMYRHMLLERKADAEATSLQRQGQLALWVPALGQEGAQVGTVAALKRTDRIFPTYREHAMALYRGIDVSELMSLFRAVQHGGWNPDSYHFNLYSIVLAAQTLHAVGWAMGAVADRRNNIMPRDKADDEVVVACLGDGASSQGDVHESMVFAASYELPVLYFVQNNHWAISVPSSTQSRAPLAARASGYGFEGVRVDGNDILGSYAVASHMAAEIRSGSGPKLIEALTYRMGAHTTADDPTKYRTNDELELWGAKDPVARYATWLKNETLADDAFFDDVAEEGKALARKLREAVYALEPMDIERVFDTVYAEPHRQIEVEKAWLKDYEAGFAEDGATP